MRKLVVAVVLLAGCEAVVGTLEDGGGAIELDAGAVERDAGEVDAGMSARELRGRADLTGGAVRHCSCALRLYEWLLAQQLP